MLPYLWPVHLRGVALRSICVRAEYTVREHNELTFLFRNLYVPDRLFLIFKEAS